MSREIERAREITNKWCYDADTHFISFCEVEILQDKIASALTECRKEVIEECAKVADNHPEQCNGKDCTSQIADAIRAKAEGLSKLPPANRGGVR